MKTLLLLVVAGLICAPSASAAFVFDVPGGEIDVKAFPGQPERVQDAVEDSIAMEEPPIAIDRDRCPTGRVVITAEKQSTVNAAARRSGLEPGKFGGILLRGRAGVDCRVYLNARSLHRLDEAQTCMLVQHELGHARGLDHTKTGLMAPTMTVLPDDEHCAWAWSDWLDT